MKKFAAAIAAFALSISTIVSISAPASAAPQDNAAFTRVSESRSLSFNTNFRAESDETGATFRIYATVSAATYAALGSGKNFVTRVSLYQGSALVGRENYVSYSGPVQLSGSGNNGFTTNGTSTDLSITSDIDAQLLQGVDYKILLSITADGNTVATSSSLITADFYKFATSITADGTESSIDFRGETCLTDAAYSTLQANDVIEISFSDAQSHTYNVSASAYTAVMSNYLNSNGPASFTMTSAALTEKVYISAWADVSSPASGAYAPVISVKKQGDATELSQACVERPSSAPTLTASATGITMQGTLGTADSMRCFLADARHPNIPVSSSTAYNQGTCTFTSLKRGDYVGWYVLEDRINNGRYVVSGTSPVAAQASYAGGNGTYTTYSGTTGGSGQGSLSLTNIDYVGSDYQTERRSSDGNGGLLVSSIEAADNQLAVRQLTPTGMSSSFGGSGTVTVSLPPQNQRTLYNSYAYSPSGLGWFGTSRDKWMVMMGIPSTWNAMGDYYGSNGALTIASGDFAGTSQVNEVVPNTEVANFCRQNIQDANISVYSGNVSQLISAPTADPLVLVNCYVRYGNTGDYTSSLLYLASYSSGSFTFKAALQDEPSASEKCSSTYVSAVNSAATGSDVMMAAYQRTWLPANTTDCFSWNTPVAPADVVSRDIFTITSGYTQTAVRDVLTVGGTTEPGAESNYNSGLRVIVSGPNTHLLFPESTGNNMNMNSTFKYRISRLSNGSFGTYENLPYLTVGSSTEFNQGTNFTQISDYSENEAGSVLLSRRDYSTGTTAARVDLTTGVLTSYQQMASSGYSMDGGSLIVGTSNGTLNFYGITSRTTAVLGQWVTSGAFDSALSALPINQSAGNTGVSNNNGPQQPPQNNVAPSAAAYNGPIVKAVKGGKKAGSKVEFESEKLTSPTKVKINGVECVFILGDDGKLEVTVPASLSAGIYDLEITSASGVLTVQDAINVMTVKTVDTLAQGVAWTKRLSDSKAKFIAKNTAGLGKIQYLLNGREVTWSRADSVEKAEGSPLKLVGENSYLLRTVDLKPGKNILEIAINGETVRRVVYSK